MHSRDASGTHLVRTMDLVGEDVQQHLRVGLCAQVSLVRQLALRLKGGAQLLCIGQVAVVNLRMGGSSKRAARLASARGDGGRSGCDAIRTR